MTCIIALQSGTEAVFTKSFWIALPSLLWFAFAVIAVLALRRVLVQFADLLLWRLRIGSAIKIASLEVGEALGQETDFSPGSHRLYDEARTDRNEDRFRQRESYYVPNRNLQLVHRVVAAKDPKYAYDVLIYLVPHPGTNATLACVRRVEYYCGKGWRGTVFTIADRARGFSLAVSTLGPFVCTAEIHFTDGEMTTIGRYIDGEMAGIPRYAK